MHTEYYHIHIEYYHMHNEYYHMHTEYDRMHTQYCHIRNVYNGVLRLLGAWKEMSWNEILFKCSSPVRGHLTSFDIKDHAL